MKLSPVLLVFGTGLLLQERTEVRRTHKIKNRGKIFVRM